MKDNLMADIEVNLESTDPKELLRSGHHAFIIKDYANAAAAIGKATQLMAQEHGDEHDSLGEVYLHYARALLEVSREEAEPLGDAIPHGDSDSDSSEEDNSADNETESEPGKEVTGESCGESAEEKKHDDKDKCTETITNGDVPSSSGVNGTAAISLATNSDVGESTEESADKDEPSDLQLAWEVLEVAKKIFTARGDSGKELLSQTLILLGDVGMESENFTDALKDTEDGLKIQETLYAKTNRKLAETQYKLGIAHATVSKNSEAIKYFEMSIATLNERIQLLKEKDDESSKKEIQEMEELIPEIKEKINDINLIQVATTKIMMDITSTLTTQVPPSEPSESTSSTKEVKNISHLVKRKRKVENTPDSNEVQPAKKPTP